MSSREGTIAVMVKLVLHLYPEMHADMVETISVVAAETYLELVDRVPLESRAELVDVVLDEVIETYLP